MTSVLDCAIQYARARYRLIPVHGKVPLTPHGAHDGTTDEATIRKWFERWPNANLGLVLEGLVVVDVDPRNGGDVSTLPHPLPPTCNARTGGGGEHYLYRERSGATYPASLGAGIDLKRGAGSYIVVEPSLHASGQHYCWLDGSEPWNQRPAEAPEWLAGASSDSADGADDDVAGAPIPEGKRNMHLTSLAGTMRNRGMIQEEIAAALLAVNAARCAPPLRDKEVKEIAQSVSRYDSDAGSQWGLGADFSTGVLAAQALIRKHFSAPDGSVLIRFWQDEFYVFDGKCYKPYPIADLREQLYREAPRTVKKRQIDDALDALRAFANLSNRIPAHSWLTPLPTDPDPRVLIPMQNGLLNTTTRILLPSTPRFFATYALTFPYDPAAPAPARWLDFLDQLWPIDSESIATLQEWFGYCLTTDTSQQKALLIVMPKRGGKGTIGRVLTALLGRENVCSPTLASFGTPFGLQPLIAKQLALISDARLGGKADGLAVTENLLRITGEDQLSIPRKFLLDHTATLTARVMVLSNEAPRFTDGSGALPSRFQVLSGSESFYGHEDPALTSKLLTELPGIFNWALEGLDRLLARGHFLQPASGRKLVDVIAKLAAPVQAFLEDECDTNGGVAEVAVATLFSAWCRWCASNGREHPGTEQTFGRDLRAAFPRLGDTQHRRGGKPIRFYVGIKLRETEAG
jgi:putative DNA primase/helicase